MKEKKIEKKKKIKQGGVSQCGLAIYIKKKYLIKETQIFGHAKTLNLQKNPLKPNQNPSGYYDFRN
jgi:hypothetical protein